MSKIKFIVLYSISKHVKCRRIQQHMKHWHLAYWMLPKG